MSLSRRKFMKAGVVAAACAVLPVKSASGRSATATRGGSLIPLAQQASSVNSEQLGYYTKSSFAPYLNTQFRVYLSQSSTRTLKLVEVRDYLATLSPSLVREASSSGVECFSLLLTCPPGRSFAQDTYLVEHEALGTFYLFLVPVSQQGKAALDYYEAIVYRRPDSSSAFNGVSTGSNTVGVGRGNSANGGKTAEEVYYFRPQEIAATAAVAIPAIDPGAAGRRAASALTMSQAPSIGGLTLGMTMDQVLALFPGIREDAKMRSSLAQPASQFGEQSLVVRPGSYTSQKSFERVSEIALTLLDGRVYTLNVIYNAPVWGHVDEFVAKFSEETRLPGAASWDAYAGMDNQLKTLRCKGFEISLFAGTNSVNMNYVQLLDTAVQQRLRDRRAKARTLRGTSS